MKIKYIPITIFQPPKNDGEYTLPPAIYSFQINEPHLRFTYLGANPRVLLALSTYYFPTPAESLLNNFSNFNFGMDKVLFSQPRQYILSTDHYFDDQGTYSQITIDGLYYFVP